MDIGYPDIPQTKTLQGHIIFSEMWETVNALAKGDQNCITKELKAWEPAPDDYVVGDVLRERLHKWCSGNDYGNEYETARLQR